MQDLQSKMARYTALVPDTLDLGGTAPMKEVVRVLPSRFVDL